METNIFGCCLSYWRWWSPEETGKEKRRNRHSWWRWKTWSKMKGQSCCSRRRRCICSKRDKEIGQTLLLPSQGSKEWRLRRRWWLFGDTCRLPKTTTGLWGRRRHHPRSRTEIRLLLDVTKDNSAGYLPAYWLLEMTCILSLELLAWQSV